MKRIIGTVRDLDNNIVKYRLVDTERNGYGDVSEKDLCNIKHVANLVVRNKKINTSDCDIDSFPCAVIDGSGTIVAADKSALMVVDIHGDDVTVCNIEGRTGTMKMSDMINKVKTFVNADVSDNRIIFKKNKLSSDGLFDELMALETKPLNSLYTNTRYCINERNIPNEVTQMDIALYLPKKDIHPAEFDPNSYSFEIVDVENRKELRKYIGKMYRGKVIIPDGVTHICTRAFEGAPCKEVVMPDSVVYLGDMAFMGSYVEKVHISKNITAIPLQCFYESKLVEIDLTYITSIDNMAFGKCNIQIVDIKAPIIQIGFKAFYRCRELREFKHPGTLQKIRHHAFALCVMLTQFDLSSVTTIEAHAFEDSGILNATVRGEVGYLQNGTFGNYIRDITIQDGLTKIAAGSGCNKEDGITWTIPNSVTNIGKGTFTDRDTVICFRKSVAASAALIDGAKIIYLDEIEPGSIPTIFFKAALIDKSIDDILRETLHKMLSTVTVMNEVPDEELQQFKVDESKLVRANIPESIFNLIDEDSFKSGKYADDKDIKKESIKFKCILEHLYRSSKGDILPFSNIMLDFSSTFYVEDFDSVSCLYTDGMSSVYKITYRDNKYDSVYSSFIVAKTYDTLRYICMANKNNDFMCESRNIADLSTFFNILTPGDTIGYSCVVNGKVYNDVAAQSDKKIEVIDNGRSTTEYMKMNLYQAMRYSGITFKLDSNLFAIILPYNRKVIKCASLGKTTWQNEKEDSYKIVQCTISSIEDLDNNTVFDYESTLKSNNSGELIKKLRKLSKSEYEDYKRSYSHIYEAEHSMYRYASDYAHENEFEDIYDTDLEFILKLLQTSLFEERPDSWLEGAIGKTIVEDVESSFEIADGSVIYQYRTVKKTALRNKLITGGDNKLYVFEVVDASGINAGVYISKYDIRTLVNMCLSMNKLDESKDKRIFEDNTKFDTCEWDDIIEVTQLGKDCAFGRKRGSDANVMENGGKFILAVYKPNGLYYIGVKVYRYKTNKFIPLILIGEKEVAFDFISQSNIFGPNMEGMEFLFKAGMAAYVKYVINDLNESFNRQVSYTEYNSLLEAKKMYTSGISDIEAYDSLDLPEVLKRCMGYIVPGKDYYRHIEDYDDKDTEDDDDFDIDESDLGLDNDFDIDESELNY